MPESTVTEPYVFLSYASVDRERALALADGLAAAGVRVWVDRRSISGGSSWDTAIVDAISRCAVLALVCSPASLASPNVQQEVRLAWEEQRPTLPLLLTPVSIPRELRYPLAGRQWVELLDSPPDAWLPDVLRALAGLGIEPGPRPPAAAESSGAGLNSNLPVALSSFVGRETELAALAGILPSARLLTLTGPGGTGKTRLALAVGERVVGGFPEGICFVDLSGLSDAALVPDAIAQVLGVREVEGQAILDVLARYLRGRHCLLILDNFEQVVAAARAVATLLSGAPGLHILVTSRVPLHVVGEREYPVPPLPLPAATAMSTPSQLAENGAVALFVTRAQDVRGDFALSAENAAAIVAICRRVDGLPLAIELAAARVRVLEPGALLARLGAPLQLLTGGGRDRPERQQTLAATIGWSYALLDGSEQRLYRRLAIFVGGCTLEAAEAVCGAEEGVGARYIAPHRRQLKR